MKLNRIQIQIFKKLAREKGLEVDQYIQDYSVEFLGEKRNALEELSEAEGDGWINTAYLQSLERGQ